MNSRIIPCWGQITIRTPARRRCECMETMKQPGDQDLQGRRPRAELHSYSKGDKAKVAAMVAEVKEPQVEVEQACPEERQ
jgi:hypothetical protein